MGIRVGSGIMRRRFAMRFDDFRGHVVARSTALGKPCTREPMGQAATPTVIREEELLSANGGAAPRGIAIF